MRIQTAATSTHGGIASTRLHPVLDSIRCVANPRVARSVLRLDAMTRSLHVRLDDRSAAALSVVRSGVSSDSEAVRLALREAAARRRARSAVAEEVARLAADEADRAEMRLIREQMAELAPAAEG